MSKGRPVSKINLSQEESEKLQLIARRPKSQQGLAQRAKIVLSCAQNKPNQTVAREMRVSVHTVGKWRRRFASEGMAGLVDAPRSGAPRQISDQKVEEVVTKTLETTPAARTHWSSWLMAKEAKISQHSVRRIWQAFGLKPHLVKSFKLSTDPMFVEKVRDITGLYLNPPEKQLSFVWMKRVKPKPWNAHNRFCRWARGVLNAKPRLLPPWHRFTLYSLRRGHRASHRRMPQPSSRRGVPQIHEPVDRRIPPETLRFISSWTI
jgi:transposase